jgi:hypothetical protein
MIRFNEPTRESVRESPPFSLRFQQPRIRECVTCDGLFLDRAEVDWLVLYGCGLLRYARVILKSSRMNYH